MLQAVTPEGRAHMTRRLATMCFMAMFLVGVCSPAVRAQADKYANATLKGISTVYVSVGITANSDENKTPTLTTESVQTDVELKLRLAGMHVVTEEEGQTLQGRPHLFVSLSLNNPIAAHISLQLCQDAYLTRDAQLVPSVPTWQDSALFWNTTVQGIRDQIKDYVDEFLNAWLSVNPKK
jgi:hypothetical protein